MKVVGSDNTESRLAAIGFASMSNSTCATSGRSAHTWSTTRRTAAHGPHQSALKCTRVGPASDKPRSELSCVPAEGAFGPRNTPDWRLTTTPMTLAAPNAATIAIPAITTELTSASTLSTGRYSLDGEVFPVPDAGFGRSDDTFGARVGLRAVGVALQSRHPGEQRLQADAYQVRQVGF